MTNEININANAISQRESVAVKRANESVEAVKVKEVSGTNLTEQNNSPAELEEIVSEMNEFVQNVQRELLFSVDEDLGDTVITVVDKTNDEIIRKIPSDEILQLRKNMQEMRGVLFSESS